MATMIRLANQEAYIVKEDVEDVAKQIESFVVGNTRFLQLTSPDSRMPLMLSKAACESIVSMFHMSELAVKQSMEAARGGQRQLPNMARIK